MMETGIAEGRISLEDVFDTGYVPIEGTNRSNTGTAFCEFADGYVQPILDRVMKQERRAIAAVITDVNGISPPTSASGPGRSRMIRWNAANCRNRCNFVDETTQGRFDSG